jgi:NAD(P)-dependent dehydrogenase (short-subunit alcohol dehydrogenase family)
MRRRAGRVAHVREPNKPVTVAFCQDDLKWSNTDTSMIAPNRSRCSGWRGRLHMPINNAAIIQHEAVHEVDLESWNRALAVNLTGVMLGMWALIPGMLARGGGSTINLSSIWGSVAAPGAASYHASKAGAPHLTKNAAVTYAKQNIRVNSIHPGIIHTPMMDEMGKATIAWVISQTPAGRTGQPEDIAAGAVYLARDEAGFVTGSELRIDGGYTAQ